MRAHPRRTRLLGLAMAGTVWFIGAQPVGQEGPTGGQELVLGSWVLNVDKSTYVPGPAPRSQRRTYEAIGDRVKATITTIDADGRSSTAGYTGAYDSVEYPFMGSPIANTITLKRLDAYTAEAALMHGSRQVGFARRVISESGQTMTITYEGSDQAGRVVKYIMVYEKDAGP